MTKTLNAPLFEVNKESKYYQTIREVKDNRPVINSILNELATTYDFVLKEFAYYGSRGFGFYEDSDSYEKFKGELMKNADKNGVFRFKKTSSMYKAISTRLLEIERITDKVDPFALHDIFGWNNLSASQWVGDRYFVEVKSEDTTNKLLNSDERKQRYEVEPVQPIDYKDYLILFTSMLEQQK